jgi:hypothetical protein
MASLYWKPAWSEPMAIFISMIHVCGPPSPVGFTHLFRRCEMREDYVNFVLCDIECKHNQMGYAPDFSATKKISRHTRQKNSYYRIARYNAVV